MVKNGRRGSPVDGQMAGSECRAFVGKASLVGGDSGPHHCRQGPLQDLTLSVCVCGGVWSLTLCVSPTVRLSVQ